MNENLIEKIGNNVWAITLKEPTMNLEAVKNLPEVKQLIAKSFTGIPYFEARSARYWYLVDKDLGTEDERDYLKEIYLEVFIGGDLLPDAKESLLTRGYLDSSATLSPQDKIQFEAHIEDGDQLQLTSKDGKDSIRVFIANLDIKTIRKDAHYKASYTLTRMA